MSSKKLAQEIERTVKKVNEGVELFDELLDKVYTAPNASQRDKFEGELKKEIKKLQRLREQIRNWLGGSEVKDKTELTEKRKVIEARMEKFKICEQKTKMKAYSKEALSQKQIQRRKRSQVIPETEEKKETKTWIRDCQENIQTQIDDVEQELEEEQKARKPDSDTIATLKKRISMHHSYIEKLETIYSYLEDDLLKPGDIEELKESVEYYIDENAEPDFVDDEETFENLKKKAEEAQEYDDFEDIEDEVVMDGNVIQAVPADGESVVQLNKNESEVLKAIEEEASRIKERQEKERLEKEQKEREEAEKERARLEQERIEREKLEKAKKQQEALLAAKQKPPVAPQAKQQLPTTQTKATTQQTTTTTTTPTTAVKDQKQAKQPKTPTKAKQTAKKLQVTTPELNFSSVVASSVSGKATPITTTPVSATIINTPTSATKIATPVSTTTPTATKQVPKLPTSSATVKNNVSYIDVINATQSSAANQTITPVVSSGSGSKNNTPRGVKSTTSESAYDPIPFIKNEMSDITIQTVPTATPVKQPSVVSNKDKKIVQPTTPPSANAGHIGQNLPSQQLSMQPQMSSIMGMYSENDKSNDETFGSMGGSGSSGSGMLGSLEDLANRTQEAHYGFQMSMPSHQAQLQQQQFGSHLDTMISSPTMHASMGFSPSPTPPSVSPQQQQTQQHLQFNKGEFMDAKSEMLQTSLNFLPNSLDCERPRQYVPTNPFDTPSFFPQEQLPILKDPAIFSQMDPDTLFFIFYFQQGSYQQYLAAKALKKHAWRYHKKYQTWFQRHDQPKHTTNDYELGTYVYFDFEQDWCQRIKGGFRFEYEFLESE
jgi:CCR4-NOT transcription complex subunit 3